MRQSVDDGWRRKEEERLCEYCSILTISDPRGKGVAAC